ncbi:MAG TPA: TIGR03943 family protein [Nocardioidaceae bacterium]|nr:TIGR03943 family protein [Nocardioidaceae bacterium]
MTPSGGTLTALVGLLTLRLTIDGTFTRYVQSGMRPWLLLAGVALFALGLFGLVIALRSHDEGAGDEADGYDDEHEDEHEDEHGVGVGWLLLAPVVTLLVVAPPSLGSYGVDRSPPIRITAGKSDLPALDPSGGPVEMTLLEYTERAFDHDGESMRDATVELTGFVSADGSGTFDLARYQIACCAADAAAAVVHIVGVASTPPRDQWVTVTGAYSSGSSDVPELAATSLQEISAPKDPYE